MNPAKALHQTAMEYNVFADVSKAKGKPLDAELFFNKAYQFEKEAAMLMPKDLEDSLPRFILLRSAAALAYKANRFEEAREIIASTLAENPPTFIKNELTEITDLINAASSNDKNNSPIHVIGRLILINVIENEITIEDTKELRSYNILVPEHLLDDILKKYKKTEVDVEATYSADGVFVLKDIRKAA